MTFLRMCRLVLTVFAIAAICSPLHAPGLVVVRAARMLDVAKGQIVSPGLVTIQGDHIRSVGEAPDSGARVIDLGDLTLLLG